MTGNLHLLELADCSDIVTIKLFVSDTSILTVPILLLTHKILGNRLIFSRVHHLKNYSLLILRPSPAYSNTIATEFAEATSQPAVDLYDL